MLLSDTIEVLNKFLGEISLVWEPNPESQQDSYKVNNKHESPVNPDTMLGLNHPSSVDNMNLI